MKNELLLKNAKEKLDRECKSVVGNKEKAMAEAVKTALLNFAEQDSEFAQAIIEKSEGFDKCMQAVAKDCGNCISDIEAYRRAVQFYFSGADISFVMKIDLCASVSGENKSLDISLMDLL